MFEILDQFSVPWKLCSRWLSTSGWQRSVSIRPQGSPRASPAPWEEQGWQSSG